jgi:branched-subunit amino acid aminotransferase/4-amino-4-deoxychorismate lyase
MELMPVIAVDGKQIGAGKPGRLTQKLHELFIGARERFLEKTSPH